MCLRNHSELLNMYWDILQPFRPPGYMQMKIPRPQVCQTNNKQMTCLQDSQGRQNPTALQNQKYQLLLLMELKRCPIVHDLRLIWKLKFFVAAGQSSSAMLEYGREEFFLQSPILIVITIHAFTTSIFWMTIIGVVEKRKKNANISSEISSRNERENQSNTPAGLGKTPEGSRSRCS